MENFATLQEERQVHSLVMNFFFWRNGPGAIDTIKFLERRLGPDTEASNMATGSNLE